jgi:hypothetical protein
LKKVILRVLAKGLIVRVVNVTGYEASHQSLNPDGGTKICLQFK